MNGAWMSMYEIASKRHHTRLGANHLSDNGLCVLQSFVFQEKQAAMEAAVMTRFLNMFSDDDD